MGQAGLEKAIEPAVGTGIITAERSAQLSIENQAGRTANPVRTAGFELPHLWPAWGGWFGGQSAPEAPPPPKITTGPNTPFGGQIDDCSKEKCIVNGKQYTNSTDIPGNHPKPLRHNDGTAVLDPFGKPVIGPDLVDLDQVVADLNKRSSWLRLPSALLGSRHGGEFDFQRITSDDVPGVGARSIFTQQYQNFANVGVGYVLASQGLSLDQIRSYSNTYCWMKGCSYNEPMSKQYPSLPERQVRDMEIGVNLYKERHPQGKDSGK